MAAASLAPSAVTSDETAEPFEAIEFKEGVVAEDFQCAVCLGLPLAPVVVRAARQPWQAGMSPTPGSVMDH